MKALWLPEVIEDFFTEAAPIVGVNPREIREDGHVYKFGKLPRTLWTVGERLEPRFGKRWLIEQAPNFDLLCIATDLLDMFKSETQLEQAREITRIIRELADLVPVAVCTGNHDNAGRLVSHDRASVYKWFIDLGTHRNIITDGSTRKLENLIVTKFLTIPPVQSR